MALQDKIDVYINQNVLVLIIGLIGLGTSEYYNIKSLYFPSLIITYFIIISVLLCMLFYTVNYIVKKLRV